MPERKLRAGLEGPTLRHLGSERNVRDIRTAVVGAGGFIGRRLLHFYRGRFPDCIGTARATAGTTLLHLDLADPALDASSLRLRETGHEAVIIAAACADVAFCERHPEESRAVNVDGTLRLVRQLGRSGMQIIFISSDYVFDGIAGGYEDETPTAPTTEYGRQKEAVEKALPDLVDDWLVVRFSKVYGLDRNDNSLLDEMAGRLARGKEVPAATDQEFTPTFVGDVVNAVHAVQAHRLRGVMNVCSPERVSRYEVARRLALAMGAPGELVRPMSLHDVPSMRGRPLITAMRAPRLQALGLTFRPLQESIEAVARNWREG